MTPPSAWAAPKAAWPIIAPATATAERGMRATPIADRAATATSAAVSGNDKRTSFRLDISAGVTAEIFTLANPYRVIVDLPDVAFALPDGTGSQGQGLIKAFRYGMFAEGKARIVIDTTGPVRVERAAMAAGVGSSVVFTFDVVATAPESFGQGTGANRPDKTAKRDEPSAPQIDPIEKKETKGRGKPLVMIDPGHGGIDAGTVGASGILEKNVVLEVAKELQSRLSAAGRYRVTLTRTTDVFVSLDQRVQLSASQGADLFISLHADSLADEAATQAVRGATVYTLSNKASNEEARRMAEKENASDLIAGLDTGSGEEADEVKGILIDLLKRETDNFAADFANKLVGNLKRRIRLSREPQRSAAFKVLKQNHSPSVLVELGYLSNREDESLMNNAIWRRDAASAIATAVDDFFAKHTSATP